MSSGLALHPMLYAALWLSSGLMLAGCSPAPDQPAGVAAPATAEEPAMAQLPSPRPPQQTPPQTAAVAVPAAKAGHAAESAALFAEIKAMVGTAAASEPAQCKKVGFGHKPCGGPASYLIYSTQGLDETLLLQKVSRYNQLMQAEQQRLGLVSDCAVVPEPGVALVGGFCVASGTGDTF